MSNNFQLRVAELICSRICHDLVSPLSAINNGIEMINEGGEGIFSDSIELIGNCNKHALDRLSFYRVAYGSGGERNVVNFLDIEKIIETFAADRKTNIVWAKDYRMSDDQIPREFAKLLTNVFYLATECLPRGGVVSIENSISDASNSVSMKLEGPKCHLRDDVSSGLKVDLSVEELSVKNIFAYLVSALALTLNKTLEVKNISSNRMEINVL